MNKIFKDKDGNLYSTELGTIYYVKTLNIKDNTVENSVITWYKVDTTTDNSVRVYDLEVNGEKFLFDLKYENNIYYFIPRSNIEISRLKSEYDIEIISEEEPIN